MAEAIRLSRMTDTMEEGFVADVNVKPGDAIKGGDAIAEIETDKATMALESYFSGTILHVAAKKGDSLKIGDLIAIIGKPGENFDALLKSAPAAAAPIAPVETKAEVATTPIPTKTVEPSPAAADSRLKASPLAKMIAKEKGIDLNAVKGSGEDGRIVKRDLETVSAPSAKVNTAVVSGTESFHDVRVSQMRKTIAKRLTQSKNEAPHFYLTMNINMDKAVALRTEMNVVATTKVSFNDLVIKAVATALRINPAVNCSWLGDTIRYNDHIHIGMAVAVEEGLLVPVIKFADSKSITQISTEAKLFAEKAGSKKLTPEEMQGNTFTISNLGMFGIEDFTAIINPPDACILAVGAIRKEPAVVGDEIKVSNQMKVTLSSDHRAVDGVIGAKFLKTLKELLEEPIRMLL